MNKTTKRILSVVLAVLMAFSCTSAALAAYDGITYTARGVSENMTNTQCVTTVVDMLDDMLKEADVTFDVGAMLKEELDQSVITALGVSSTATKVLNLVIDARSVNALLGTIDDIFDILYTKKLLSNEYDDSFVWGTLKTMVDLGDIEDVTLLNWTKGLTRRSGDVKVLGAIISLVNDNASVIGKVVENTFSTGILEVTSKDFLGENGVSGMLKEELVKSVYPDTESAEYKAAVTKTIDEIIFDLIVPQVLANEDGALPGLTLNASTSIDSLLTNAWNICWTKYIAPELQKISIGYDPNNALAMAFSEVVKLDFYNAETGVSTFDTNYTLDTSKSFLSQVNGLLGFLAEQFIQDDYAAGFTWETAADGGYSLLGKNIENLFIYILKSADFSGTAYAAEVAEVLSDTPDYDEVILLTAKVLMAEFAGDYNTAEVQSCDSIDGIAFLSLKKFVTEDLGLNITYSASDDYLDVCADVLAYYADIIMPMGDYAAGSGSEFDDVLNYIADYYQFDKGFQKALNLDCAKTDKAYEKVDALFGLFYSSATAAADRFNTKTFLFGDAATKGLIKSVFSVDVQGVLDVSVAKFLNHVTGISGMTAVKMLYSIVKNLLDNMFNKKIIATYSATSPFENMVSNANLKSTVVNMLSAINANKTYLLPTVCYLVTLFMPVEKDWSVKVADAEYTGNPVTPAATVKFDGKTLVADKDYRIVYSDNVAIGTGNAVITGIGNYEGTTAATFNVTPVDISKATATPSVVNYTYTGRACTPDVTVTLGGKKLVKDTDYTVAYKNNINPGLATATITGKGMYGGTLSAKFYVRPTSAVTGLKESARTSTTLTLAWAAVKGATGYYVFVNGASKAVVTTTTAKISGLAANTNYKVKIRPITKASDGKVLFGNYSAEITARTAPAKTTVKVSGNTATSVKVSWSAVTSASKYQLYKYDYATRKWSLVTATTATSYTVTKLTANSPYLFRVRAYSYLGGVIRYADVSANVATRTLPGAVTGIKVSSAGEKWVKLTWTKVAGATSYEIYTYNASTKRWGREATVTTNSATISGLASLKTYQYRIRAIVKSGSTNYIGAFSGTVNATTAFTKATGLAASSTRTTTAIGLKWTKVSGATGYQIYKYDANTRTYKLFATTTATSYTVKGLTAGTSYFFQVKAIRKVGRTTYYGENSAYVKIATCPAAVTGLTSSARTGSTVTLKWTATKGATSYMVYRYNASTKKWVSVGTATTNTFKVTGLSRNTNYAFKVRAVIKTTNATSYGAYSAQYERKTSIF